MICLPGFSRPRGLFRLAGLICATMLIALPLHADHVCSFTTATITIDGQLTEPVWSSATPIAFKIPATQAKPASRTEARMVWDAQFLYVAFKAWDQDLTGSHTERDSATWKDDVLEVFLRPLRVGPDYYNFEINVLGTVYDAENSRTPADAESGQRPRVQSRRDWNCDGLRHAVFTQGTINDNKDKDQFWTLELAIPLAELPALKGRMPQAGDRWEFNLARYDYSIYLPNGKELSASAPLRIVNFHALEDFAGLKFGKE